MNKKAIAILGAIFLLIVGTLGVLIYSKYSNKSQTVTTPPTNQTADTANSPNPPVDNSSSNASNTPVTPVTPMVVPTSTPATSTPASVKFVKLTATQVIAPTLFFNGQAITYLDSQGGLFQATLSNNQGVLSLTNTKQIAIPQMPGLNDVLWPDAEQNFMAVTAVGGRKAFSLFDSTKDVYTALSTQVYSMDWMPQGQKIIYAWVDLGGKYSLNISDPNGQNYQKLGNFYYSNVQVKASPDGKNILFYQDNNSGATNSIGLVSADGKSWKTVVPSGYNLGVLWSPDSQKFLFAKKDPNLQQYELWYYNLATSEIKNLGLFTTTDKVVWDKDNQTIYAAVPTIGVVNGNSVSSDVFYKFNTGTMQRIQYTPSNLILDGRNMFLSLDDSKLFFKNAQDGTLYYLDLNQPD